MQATCTVGTEKLIKHHFLYFGLIQNFPHFEKLDQEITQPLYMDLGFQREKS